MEKQKFALHTLLKEVSNFLMKVDERHIDLTEPEILAMKDGRILVVDIEPNTSLKHLFGAI